MISRILPLVLFLVFLILIGCGGGSSSSTTATTVITTTSTTTTTTPDQGSATVESISITCESTSVTVEGMIAFSCTAVYSDSSTISVNSLVSWESSNTLVGTMDVYGTFRATSAGTTSVYATYESLASNTIEVTVTAAPGDAVDEAKENMSFTELEYFPVDLDTLFNRPGGVEGIQQSISDGGPLSSQSNLLISPFMQHFGTAHSEGTGKWYIWAQGVVEIRAPGRILMDVDDAGADYWDNRSTTTVSNESVYSNCRLDFWLDNEKSIRFDHMDFLESHVVNLLASPEGYIIIEAGERLGYTRASSGLDFYMTDTAIDNGISEGLQESGSASGINHRACPLSYYTTELQTDINTYYDDVMYSAMQSGGKWPESLINSPVNINITGEVWGTWYYKSGDIEGVDLDRASWFHFDEAILTFLAEAKTNSETFFKDIDADTDISIEAVCPNWAGLYTQYSDPNDQAYLVLESGNSVSGVFSRREFGTGDILNYIRFEVDVKTDSLYDDELNVKFFAMSAEAVADDMTSGYVTYIKDDEKASPQ